MNPLLSAMTQNMRRINVACTAASIVRSNPKR